jgi:hypothetical protein
MYIYTFVHLDLVRVSTKYKIQNEKHSLKITKTNICFRDFERVLFILYFVLSRTSSCACLLIYMHNLMCICIFIWANDIITAGIDGFRGEEVVLGNFHMYIYIYMNVNRQIHVFLYAYLIFIHIYIYMYIYIYIYIKKIRCKGSNFKTNAHTLEYWCRYMHRQHPSCTKYIVITYLRGLSFSSSVLACSQVMVCMLCIYVWSICFDVHIVIFICINVFINSRICICVFMYIHVCI